MESLKKLNGQYHGRYFQGVFKPQHPEKYKGNLKNISYRSSWEFKFMRHLDTDPTVIAWASEELAIPYTDPKTNKLKRYFPDFVVERMVKGKLQKYVIEIKPYFACLKPEKKKKQSTKAFIEEVVIWARNQAKWEAADRWAKGKGMTFQVLTEHELGIKQSPALQPYRKL